MLRLMIVFQIAIGSVSNAQVKPIVWITDIAPGSSDKNWTLTVTATMAPGWHLYSQFMEEGGPIPTKFELSCNADCTFNGAVEEAGELQRFHDGIYDMTIAWFTGKARFTSKFHPGSATTVLNVKVDYMVCNEHICVPEHKEFQVPLKQSP
jgi:hypothetical protein